MKTKIIWTFVFSLFYFVLQQTAFFYFNKISGLNFVVFLGFAVLLLVVFLFFSSGNYALESFGENQTEKIPAVLLVSSAASAVLLGLIGNLLATKNMDVAAFLFFAAALLLIAGVFWVKGNMAEYSVNTAGVNYENERKDGDVLFMAVSLVLSFAMFAFSVASFKVRHYNACLTLFSMGVILLGLGGAKGNNFRPGKGYTLIDLIAVLLWFGLALAIRLYKIDSIPPGVGMEELEAIGGAGLNPKVNYSMMFGTLYHPVMQFEWLGWVGRTFGFTLTNLRMLDVFAGSATVIFVYIAAKELFGSTVASAASFFYTFMYIGIFFSRTMFFWIFPVFYISGLFCFIVLAVKRQKTVFFAAAGFIAGLSMYSYHSGKAAIIIALVIFLLFLLHPVTRKKMQNSWQLSAVFLTVLTITLMPLLFYIMKEPDLYLLRASGEGLKLPSNMKDLGAINRYFYDIFNHFAYVLDIYFSKGPGWGGYMLPFNSLFDGVTAVVFFAGTALCLVNFRDVRFLVLLFMIFMSMAPGLFSGTPDGGAPSRMIIVMPFMAIASGLAVCMLPMHKIISDIKLKAVMLGGILLLLMPLVIFDNLNKYFVAHANDPSLNFAYNNTLKRVAETASRNRDAKIIYSEHFSWRYGDHLRALLSNYKMKPEYSILPTSQDFNQIYESKGGDVFLFMDGIYWPQAEMLKEIFPGAVLKKQWNRNFWIYEPESSIKYCFWNGKDADEAIKIMHNKANDEPVNRSEPMTAFITVRIPASDINSGFGLKAVLFKNGNKVSDTIMKGELENTIGADRAELNGMIYLPSYEKIEFKAENAYIESVQIDSSPLGMSPYPEGLHNIKLSLRLKNGLSAKILVMNLQSKVWEPIQPYRLLTRQVPQKVKVEYIYGNGAVFYLQNMPALNAGFFFYKPPVVVTRTKEPEYKSLWNAKIMIEKEDVYQLKVDTVYKTRLFVDGNLVFDNRQWPNRIDFIRLSAGIHSVKAESEFRNELTNFRLMLKKGSQRYYRTPSYYEYR